MEIRDQVFIVTGGASGPGAGTACMLTETGGKVVTTNPNEAVGTALAQELGGRFVRCNVTPEADGQAIVKAATPLGTLCGLVNYAGITMASRTTGKTKPHLLGQFARVISINLIGTFNMTRLAATAMASNAPDVGGECGVIINTASVTTFDGQVGQVTYAVSKGGVVATTLATAYGLSCDGIRVMTITPGILKVPMLLGMPAGMQDALSKMVPFPPRLGKPSEHAQFVCAIVENPMFNGETIHLDGAIRMQPK